MIVHTHLYLGICSALCLTKFFGHIEGVSSNRETRAYDEASQIYSTVFDQYDPQIRPQSNHSEPVIVAIDIKLEHIYSFDVVEQTLHSLLTLSLNWSDRRLAWYPKKLQSIYVIKEKLWIPTISFHNGLSLPQDLDQETIHLEFKGNLFWHRKLSVKTYCPTDLNNETHACAYQIGSTQYKNSEERFQLTTFSISDTFSNHYWDISNDTDHCDVLSHDVSLRCVINISEIKKQNIAESNVSDGAIAASVNVALIISVPYMLLLGVPMF